MIMTLADLPDPKIEVWPHIFVDGKEVAADFDEDRVLLQSSLTIEKAFRMGVHYGEKTSKPKTTSGET